MMQKLKYMDSFVLNIIIINIIVYIAETVLGVNYVATMFGSYYPFVFQQGQFYRLLTYGFVHGSILHIVLNMYALMILFEGCVAFTSRKASYIIYMAGLLISGLGATLFDRGTLVIGASGAIYALMGVIIYQAIKEKRKGYDQRFNSLLPILIINVVISFTPGISFYGHFFGLVVGFAGKYIYDKNKRRQY